MVVRGPRFAEENEERSDIFERDAAAVHRERSREETCQASRYSSTQIRASRIFPNQQQLKRADSKKWRKERTEL